MTALLGAGRSKVVGVILLPFLFLLVLPGCGRLAPIGPVSPEARSEIDRRCQAHFLERPWWIVQSITVYMPGGGVRNAIGVTLVYPDEERIRCVITSIEGITFLDAEHNRAQDPEIRVVRAIPPFDDETFARALFEDIRLVFFAPDARYAESGITAAGIPVCRYALLEGGFVEVMLPGKDEDGWGLEREIRSYTARKKHVKTIDASYDGPAGTAVRGMDPPMERIPSNIAIHRHGLLGYRLELGLIDAKVLDGD